MKLAGFDSQAFLRDHWQKRPLCIRNPWRSWTNPLDPDDLAGLACEDGVEARLVTQTHGRLTVEHGPFARKRFARLGRKRWTLLVQAVDHAVPAVAELIAPFRFVPDWRIDDVMVSYATDGGGVGPHFDQYDVFLVQGLGRRRWQVGAPCDTATALMPHDDLRLLATFEAIDEWILEPGDMLYVPARVAHSGVALGSGCMTYSVGFRAPSRSELIAHWCDALLAGIDDDDRYADPDLVAQANPGEIGAPAIARLQAMVTETLLDGDAFTRWFGEYTTARKDPDADVRPTKRVQAAALGRKLAKGGVFARNPASRFAFVRRGPGALWLFVDGRRFDCTGDAATFAEQLCAAARLVPVSVPIGTMAVLALIAGLLDQGSVVLHRPG